MSDTLRAVALLLSLLLWSPACAQLLRGEVSADRAGLLYAAALLLSLAGCGLIARIVGAYAPEDEPAEHAARRAEDAAT